MCVVKDQPNDPHEGHSPDVEPGREKATVASVDALIKQLKYFWFVLIPVTVWVARVEGFVQKGDRQTALMAEQQHAMIIKEFDTKLDKLPPQLYRDYIDAHFKLLHQRLDQMEKMIEEQ